MGIGPLLLRVIWSFRTKNQTALVSLRTLNYGNFGIFLIMGNAGFCPSTVFTSFRPQSRYFLHTWSPRETLNPKLYKV